MERFIRLAAALVFTGLATAAGAQHAGSAGHSMGGAGMHGYDGMKQAGTKAHTGVGIVKGIDAEKGRITVSHEAIPSLGWPAMTMPLPVADASLLAGLAPGRKIEFELVRQGEGYAISAIR